MPGYDKTGPLGQGSRTGRKQGKCIREDSLSNLTNEKQYFEQPSFDDTGQRRRRSIFGLGRKRRSQNRGQD